MRTVRYNVPMVRQQFSPVCWLASALMIIQFKQRATMSTEELQRRAGLQGPDFRQPGLTVASEYPTGPEQSAALTRLGFTRRRFDELSDQLNGEREQSARLETAQAQGMPLGTMAPPRRGSHRETVRPAPLEGEEVLFWVLANHGPFVLLHNVGAFSYGANLPIPPQALGSGHAVAVTGFYPARHRVTFNNPWGQRDVPATASSILGAMDRWEGRTPNNASIFWL